MAVKAGRYGTKGRPHRAAAPPRERPRVVVRTVVDDDLVQTVKQVAEDVVLVMNGLEARNNTGAF